MQQCVMDATIEYLADAPEYAPLIAKRLFQEFHYLLKGKTEQDIVEKMQKHCNKETLPLTFVLQKNTHLIGTVSLRERDVESHAHIPIWLASLYVEESFRGKGIGRYLVSCARQKARQLGYEKLYLFTPNKTAFYTYLGWDVVEQVSVQGFPCDIMCITTSDIL